MTPEREAEIRAYYAHEGEPPVSFYRPAKPPSVYRFDVADLLAARLAALRAEVHDVLAEPHAYIGGRERSVLTCAVAAATAPAVEAYTRRADAVRALPVLATCGECGWCVEELHVGSWCDRDAKQRDVDHDAAPPGWCPLRGKR